MKKQLSVLLCLCLLAAFGAASAGAAETTRPEIYILTAPVPAKAIQFARRLTANLPQEIKDQAAGPSSVISLGAPFALENEPPCATLYYFPVLLEGRIVYTYRVYKSGWSWGYAGSVGLADELSKLAGETTAEAPALIYLDENRDIVLQTQDSARIIAGNPEKEHAVPAPRAYADELAARRSADPQKASMNIMEPLPPREPAFFDRAVQFIDELYNRLVTAFHTWNRLPDHLAPGR